MTYDDANRQIYKFIEEEMDSMTPDMLDLYDQAYTDIKDKLESIYGKYLAGIETKDFYPTMIAGGRLEDLMMQVQALYKNYAEQAGQSILDISEMSFTTAYQYQMYLFNWSAPDLSFSMLDDDLIKTVTTGETEFYAKLAEKLDSGDLWGGIDIDATVFQPKYGTLSSIIEKNETSTLLKINQSITQGFIQGLGVDDVSKDLQDVFDTDKYNADRIAQTEMNRCANAGSYAATCEAADQGIEVTRVWVATLDDKTRDTHADLDGQEVGVDEPFTIGDLEAMYPGDFGDPAEDINCRCTTIAVANGQKPEARNAVDPVTGEQGPIDFMSYREWEAQNGIE